MASPRDVHLWHAVMSVSMVAMLVSPLSDGLSRLALVVFALCVGWCVVQMVRGASFWVYLRLGVCGVAMLAMLVPHRSAHAMHDMVEMASDPLTTVLTGVLIFALGCVAVAAGARLAIGWLAARSGTGVPNRLEPALEVAMATAMAFMLTAFV